MKQFGVFLTLCVGLALAGVGTLSPGEEQEKLELFNRLCLSGVGGENGRDFGGSLVFCKRSPNVWRQEHYHEVTQNLGSRFQQEIFVQPPPLELRHRLVVNTQVDGGRTKVYVVPNQVKNQYDVDVRDTDGKQGKPAVFYLNQDGSSSSSGQIRDAYGAPAQTRPAGYPNRNLVQYPSTVSIAPSRETRVPGYA